MVNAGIFAHGGIFQVAKGIEQLQVFEVGSVFDGFVEIAESAAGDSRRRGAIR
jgi:hypothetical protein